MTAKAKGIRWVGLVLAPALSALILLGGAAAVSSAANQGSAGEEAPAAVCPGGQCFEDVVPSNPFYEFVNALGVDDVISGYTCGGAGEPCVPPNNRPYYRPNNNVTRAQMSKFVENGRRNISDAIGDRLVMTNSLTAALVISNTNTDSVRVNNSSSAEAVQSTCTRAGTPCYAFYGTGQVGGYASVMLGGRGTYLDSNEANQYTLNVQGGDYRGAYVTSNDTAYYSLYVDAPISTPTAGNFAAFNTSVNIFGNLNVSGSKGGYVVDIMQNVDGEALQPGDVVVIAGSREPVLGQIPVVAVKKASEAYDSRVVGIVDQVLYVPDAATRTTYQAQEKARREAMARQSEAMSTFAEGGAKPALGDLPEATISDAEGTIRALPDAKEVAPEGYANVVTLGAYKGVKVDASFGAIRAGDLLVASPNPGYAMKATDKAQASGATIGKALADLAEGTGLIPVMVTLK